METLARFLIFVLRESVLALKRRFVTMAMFAPMIPVTRQWMVDAYSPTTPLLAMTGTRVVKKILVQRDSVWVQHQPIVMMTMCALMTHVFPKRVV
jgi:Cu/Ag efflux protein CusF